MIEKIARKKRLFMQQHNIVPTIVYLGSEEYQTLRKEIYQMKIEPYANEVGNLFGMKIIRVLEGSHISFGLEVGE